MQLIAQCYHYLFWGALLLLGAGLIAVLVYIIRWKSRADTPSVRCGGRYCA